MKRLILSVFLLFGSVPTVCFGTEQVLDDGQKAERVQELVAMVVAHYKTHGIEATVARLNSGWTLDGEFYVFVDRVSDGMVLALPARTHMVGTYASDYINSEGRHVIVEIINTAREEGAWIEYRSFNPVTDEDENKQTWLIRIDDYVFGSGFYTAY